MLYPVIDSSIHHKNLSRPVAVKQFVHVDSLRYFHPIRFYPSRLTYPTTSQQPVHCPPPTQSQNVASPVSYNHTPHLISYPSIPDHTPWLNCQTFKPPPSHALCLCCIHYHTPIVVFSHPHSVPLRPALSNLFRASQLTQSPTTFANISPAFSNPSLPLQ